MGKGCDTRDTTAKAWSPRLSGVTLGCDRGCDTCDRGVTAKGILGALEHGLGELLKLWYHSTMSKYAKPKGPPREKCTDRGPGWCPHPEGRPSRHPVNDELIARLRQLAAQQLTQTEIALVLGYNATYFSELKAKHPEIAEALKEGYASGVEEVTRALLANVQKGNVVAQIFFLKSKGGWYDGGKSGHDDDSNIIQKRISEALDRITEDKPEGGASGSDREVPG